MCGIAGLICLNENITPKNKTVFKELMFVSQLRGIHSTGIITSDKEKRTRWFKTVDCATDLLYTNPSKFSDLMNNSKNFLIGHVRHATKGAKNVDNAHPFNHKHITGVHNGTIQGPYANRDKFDTDSEALYYTLAEEDCLDTTMTKMYTHNCAFSLAWYNEKEQTLSFIRNKERPLWFTYSNDGETLYFASEYEFLRTILNRNKVEHGQEWQLGEHIEMMIHLKRKKKFDKKRLTINKFKEWGKKRVTGGWKRGWQEDNELWDNLYRGRVNQHTKGKEETKIYDQKTNKWITIDKFNELYNSHVSENGREKPVTVPHISRAPDWKNIKQLNQRDLKRIKELSTLFKVDKDKIISIYKAIWERNALNYRCKQIRPNQWMTDVSHRKMIDNGCITCYENPYSSNRMFRLYWIDSFDPDKGYICNLCAQEEITFEAALEEDWFDKPVIA